MNLKNTEKEQQLSNSKDHDYYGARGQYYKFSQSLDVYCLSHSVKNCYFNVASSEATMRLPKKKRQNIAQDFSKE